MKVQWMLKVEKTVEGSVAFSYVKFSKNCGFTGSTLCVTLLGGDWYLVYALKHSKTHVNLSQEFVLILVFINNQGSRTSVSKEKVCSLSIRLLQYISPFFFLSKHWSKRKQREWEESWSIQRTSFGVWSVEQGEIVYRLVLFNPSSPSGDKFQISPHSIRI